MSGERVAGAICCFTGQPTDMSEIVHVRVRVGPRASDVQTFFTTRASLRAALHPSIADDLYALDDEEDE